MKLLEPSTTSVDSLCDWAEVRALVSRRRDCTKGDIQQYIKADDYDSEDVDIDESDLKDAELDERQANEVLGHARERSRLLGKGYPFIVKDRGLFSTHARTSKGELKAEYEAYVYNLLLSCIDSSYITPDDRHYFEVECATLLSKVFGTLHFHFGWTKHNASLGKIENRVSALCNQTSIRWKKKAQINPSYVNQNDVGVDIVLWQRQFDSRENTLVMIGQCASGHNWDAKLASNAEHVLADLLHDSPSAPIVRVFCLPFVVPSRNWRRITVESRSVVFDRIRLAAATQQEHGQLYRTRNSKWVKRVLEQLNGTM